jgi:hypothetical protein
MDEKLKIILKKLIEKTKNKKAIWKKTSGEGFKIRFPDGIIDISCIYGNFDIVSGCYSISVFNNRGDRIDNYATDNTHSEDFILLEELYNQVSKVYYKVGETYESFMKSVDSEMIIGEDPKDKDNEKVKEINDLKKQLEW